MPQVVRDELFLIRREGNRNAVTHAQAKTITVEVDIADGHVRAAVEDDDRGFEAGEGAVHATGTGITSMKERTAILGGNLDLISAPDKGTRVEIFLPLPKGSRR